MLELRHVSKTYPNGVEALKDVCLVITSYSIHYTKLYEWVPEEDGVRQQK